MIVTDLHHLIVDVFKPYSAFIMIKNLIN